jgi:hypothetical protein
MHILHREFDWLIQIYLFFQQILCFFLAILSCNTKLIQDLAF